MTLHGRLLCKNIRLVENVISRPMVWSFSCHLLVAVGCLLLPHLHRSNPLGGHAVVVPKLPEVPAVGPTGAFMVELLIFNGYPFKDHWAYGCARILA